MNSLAGGLRPSVPLRGHDPPGSLYVSVQADTGPKATSEGL